MTSSGSAASDTALAATRESALSRAECTRAAAARQARSEASLGRVMLRKATAPSDRSMRTNAVAVGAVEGLLLAIVESSTRDTRTMEAPTRPPSSKPSALSATTPMGTSAEAEQTRRSSVTAPMSTTAEAPEVLTTPSSAAPLSAEKAERATWERSATGQLPRLKVRVPSAELTPPDGVTNANCTAASPAVLTETAAR